jgi:hypothetical protein
MSAILHPVQNHAWWYAAAAALATGLLVVLMTVVFSGSGLTDTVPSNADVVGYGHAYAPPCFAGHPGGGSIELARSRCRA